MIIGVDNSNSHRSLLLRLILLCMSGMSILMVNRVAEAYVDGSEFTCTTNKAVSVAGDAQADLNIVTPIGTSLARDTWYKVNVSGGEDCDARKGSPGCGVTTNCKAPKEEYTLHNVGNLDKPFAISIKPACPPTDILVYDPVDQEEMDERDCMMTRYEMDNTRWILIPHDSTLTSVTIELERAECESSHDLTSPKSAEKTFTVEAASDVPISRTYSACTATGTNMTATVLSWIDTANQMLLEDEDGPPRDYDANDDNNLINDNKKRGEWDRPIVKAVAIQGDIVHRLDDHNPAPGFPLGWSWKDWLGAGDEANDPDPSISDDWPASQSAYNLVVVSTIAGSACAFSLQIGDGGFIALEVGVTGQSLLHEHGHFHGSLEHVDRTKGSNPPNPDYELQGPGYNSNVMYYDSSGGGFIGERDMYTETDGNPAQPTGTTESQDATHW